MIVDAINHIPKSVRFLRLGEHFITLYCICSDFATIISALPAKLIFLMCIHPCLELTNCFYMQINVKSWDVSAWIQHYAFIEGHSAINIASDLASTGDNTDFSMTPVFNQLVWW